MFSDGDAYNIAKIYEQIENELIDDMMKNFKRHRAEELKGGYNWEQWQVLQLQALEEYRKKNLKYIPKFQSVEDKITEAIKNANAQGGADAERKILNAIKRGYKAQRLGSDQFFRVNENRVNALISASLGEFHKAQSALLRQADDQYRQIIFKTQLQASTGAVTYEKAVDLATKDFLSKGIQCIMYKNGTRHTISSYAEMAMRTSMKRSFMEGEAQKRNEWGISTVIVNHRNHACSKCLPFIGKVLIDDVYGLGNSYQSQSTGYPLLSSAIQAGFLHPNCKDGTSTYFDGITEKPKPMTEQEKAYAEAYETLENDSNGAYRRMQGFERLAQYALDPRDQKMYLGKYAEWKAKYEELEKKRKAIPKKPKQPKIELPTDETALRATIGDLKKQIANKPQEIERLEKKLQFWEDIKAEASFFNEDILQAISDRKIAFANDPIYEPILKEIEENLEAFQNGTYKTAKDVKKELKALEKQLESAYDELEKVIGEPNVVNLAVYGEKYTKEIKRFLDDAPSDLRTLWNNSADRFQPLKESQLLPNEKKGAFYCSRRDGVWLRIRSVAKGDDLSTPYETVFHEYGHNIDYILNRKIGDGNQYRSFTETYKDGIFGKTIRDECEKALDEFSDANNIYGRREIQTEFAKYIKSNYTLADRGNISDMFESNYGFSYPFGAGHGASYWRRNGTGNEYIGVGKEAFAEMYASMIANEGSWALIQKYFPKSVEIFKEIIEMGAKI